MGILASMPSQDVPIRATHLPFDPGNPYQQRLSDELRQIGVEVSRRALSLHPAYRQWRRWHADIVHYHWLSPADFGGDRWRIARRLRMESFFAQLRLLKAHRPAVVWTIHNLADHESPDPREDVRFLARMCAAVDACVVHSESARSEVLSAVASAGADPAIITPKLHVVPHGNYVGCYRPARSRSEQRARLGLADHHVLVAALGQIREYKNAVALIHAFRHGADDDLRLLIGGSPRTASLDASIRAAIAGDPRILYQPGFLPDGELAAHLEACDVVALPYRACLTSGAAILAMTFGKPVIAPDRGCFREILAAQAHLLYDERDPQGLPEAIARCARAQDVIESAGAANRVAAEAMPWSNAAAKTRELYVRLRARGAEARDR